MFSCPFTLSSFWVYSLLSFLASLGKLYSPHLPVLEVHKISKMGHPIPLLLKPFPCWCAILSSWTQAPLLCLLSCCKAQINIKLQSSSCTFSKMQKISTSPLHILKKLPQFTCLNILYFSVCYLHSLHIWFDLPAAQLRFWTPHICYTTDNNCYIKEQK